MAAVNSAGGDEGERCHGLLLRDLALLEFQLQRVYTVAAANEREQEAYAQRLARLEVATGEAVADIERLKAALDAARVERRHKEEYEALRRLCVQHPSRSETLAAITMVQADLGALQAESDATDARVARRRQLLGGLLGAVDAAVLAVEDDEAEPAALAVVRTTAPGDDDEEKDMVT